MTCEVSHLVGGRERETGNVVSASIYMHAHNTCNVHVVMACQGAALQTYLILIEEHPYS